MFGSGDCPFGFEMSRKSELYLWWKKLCSMHKRDKPNLLIIFFLQKLRKLHWNPLVIILSYSDILTIMFLSWILISPSFLTFFLKECIATTNFYDTSFLFHSGLQCPHWVEPDILILDMCVFLVCLCHQYRFLTFHVPKMILVAVSFLPFGPHYGWPTSPSFAAVHC